MRDDDWKGLDDFSLERILIERWLYRGLMLGVILLSGMAVTWMTAHGLEGVREHVTVGVLAALALAAGVVMFVMRQQDLRIHRELRDRRRRGRT
jgi:hypothetical protein